MLHLQGIFTVRKSVSYAVRDLQAWINCCVIEHGETETRVDNSGVSLCSFTKLPLAKLDQMHSQQFTSVPQLTWMFPKGQEGHKREGCLPLRMLSPCPQVVSFHNHFRGSGLCKMISKFSAEGDSCV